VGLFRGMRQPAFLRSIGLRGRPRRQTPPRFPFSLVVLAAAVIALGQPNTALATTHIGTTTYTSNTTWTTAGSPYVLDGNVTVASGVTLTINPGVIVKFNGTFRTMTVNGTLSAVGTSSNPITFTSYQDDSAGGDTNGDGSATTGAAGQWSDIEFDSSSSQLAYVNVRYGGYGSAQDAAPIYLYGSGYAVTLDHATISNNLKSAVSVGNRASATITNSTLSTNTYGLYVNTATATVDHTTVSNNSSRGVWFNLPNFTPLPAASKITSSEITANSSDGIYIGANGDYPVASMPTGSGNNIYANNSNGTQLETNGSPAFKNVGVNWRGNYWGDGVYHWFNAGACGGSSPNSLDHLAYRSGTGNVPAGPIGGGTYLVNTTWCGYDNFKFGPGDFSPTKFDTSPRESWGQAQGLCEGAGHSRNETVCLADPVNSATGSFSHSETDLSYPGAGVPFVFSRAYNSDDLTSGELGQGWTDSMSASLIIRSNGDVTLRGEDGQQVDYIKQPDGSFVGIAGALSSLVAVQGGYDLTRSDQVKYHFDSQGRLSSLVDRNGQGLTLAYGGDGKLGTVTDANNRTYTFTHNGSGLLTQISAPGSLTVSYGYTNGLLTSVTDVRGKVWTYTYESHNFLEKEIDPLNHTVFRNVYTSDGRVSEQYDALNNKTTFSWDQSTQTQTATDARNNTWKDVYANNVLIKRIDALSNQTQFGSDNDLNQTGVTAPGGAATSMTYDSRGNLLTATAPASLGNVTKTLVYNARNDATSITDARGKVTSYGYDANGNNTTITQDGTLVATYTYNSSGQVTSFKDGRNNTTTDTYDANGNVASETDALGDKTTYTYDNAGHMLTRVDPRGNVQGADPNQYTWTYTYDPAGHHLTETDPLGHVTTNSYDDAGNLTSTTDPDNHTTSYTYDANDHVLTSTAADTGVTTYTYDAVGSKLTEKNPNNKTTTYSYDADNRLASVTTPLGNKTTYSYDSKGNLTKRVEPRGNVQGANPDDYATTYTYDAAGRMLTGTDPLGDTTTYAYDADGNTSSVTDANNHTTSYTYDGLNRLTSVTAPGNATTTYVYDAAGNITSRTDANNHITTYVYDGANRLASMTLPLNRQWTYGYDAAGNLTSVTDANGNSTQTTGDGSTAYTYDHAGRLTSIDYSDSTPDVTYTYDAAGNRTQMTDGAGTKTYAYDSVNRLTQVTRGSDSFAYTYDLAGNLTRRTYPDSTVVDYTYDDDSRMATVTSGGQTTGYSYDAAGNPTHSSLPSGTGYVEDRTYDHAGRLTRVKTSSTGSTLADFTYTLDADGNPTQVVRAGGAPATTTYSYDNRNRLTEACFQTSCPGGSDPFIRWTYDSVGNRLSEARPTGTTNYTYNAADELTAAGSTTYSYDQDGNETADGSKTFSYDLANRLAATTSGSTTTTYSYDGDGNRLQASTGAQASDKTNYLWDPNGPLPELAAERDGANAVIRRYVNGGRTVSMTEGGSTFYYVYDGIGSVVNVVSSTGSTEWTYSYEPFGATRTQTQDDPNAPTNVVQFAGELADPTALYYLRARQYDPTLGRLLTVDPARPDEATPAASTYAYAADRPTVLADPSGATFEPTNAGLSAALNAGSPVDQYGPTTPLTIETAAPGQPPGGLIPSVLKRLVYCLLHHCVEYFSRREIAAIFFENAEPRPTTRDKAESYADSFADDHNLAAKLEQGRYFHRYTSPGWPTEGFFLTRWKFQDPAHARSGLSLPDGNDATQIQDVWVERRYTLAFFGRVARSPVNATQFLLMWQGHFHWGVPRGNWW
jgi:RHS repeat-associated protein